MANYTIPAGKTGYLCSFFASTVGGVKTAINEIHLVVRPFGQVFQTKHAASIVSTGTSHFRHAFDVPEVIPAKAAIFLFSSQLFIITFLYDIKGPVNW